MHVHDDVLSAARLDFDGAACEAHRNLVPIHANPHTLFFLNRPLRFAQRDPRNARRGGKYEWLAAPIENVDVAALLVEVVKRRKSCFTGRAGPSKRRTFNGHAE